MGEVLYDLEMEQAMIGAVLIDPSILPELTKMISPSDFHDRRHVVLWEACSSMCAEGLAVDYLTIASRLQTMGKLQEAGGDPYLTHLISVVPTSLHANEYATKVKEYSIRRKMVRDAQEQVRRAMDPKTPVPLDDNNYLQKRFAIRTAADALKPQAPPEWVVEKLVSRGSVSIFFGDPGAKKTYSLLSMAVCVAVSKPWAGKDVKQCKILFVDEEVGERWLSLRLAEVLRGASAEEDIPFEYISFAGFKLDNPNDVKLLETLIIERGIGLVIFDALADVMTGDENSKQDVQPVFNALRTLAEKTNAAIIVIHHSNKLGGYRGSSVIKGAVDLMVLVQSKDGSEFIEFTTEKNRYDKPTKWATKGTWLKDPDRFYLTEAEVLPKSKRIPKSQQYVLDYLKEHGPSSLKKIAADAEACSPQTATRAVYDLADEKKIKRTNVGEYGQGVEAIYAIAEASGSDDQVGL